MSNPDTETPRGFLRRATAPLHAAVEAAFAPLDLSTHAGLCAFLAAQLAAVGPVEDELEIRGIAACLPDWPQRRRRPALDADLALLDPTGRAAADPGGRTIRLPSLGAQMGALYVLEGSRLGGRVLTRMVEASPEPIVRVATAFLRHQAGPGAWSTFVTILDGCGAPRADLMSGAVQTFELFEAAARRVAAGPPSR